jgi:hypothetical protein
MFTFYKHELNVPDPLLAYINIRKTELVHDSSVGIATGWTIGFLGFDSRRGLGIFLFATASRTALGPTQPPIQWVPGALSLGVKRPGCEADQTPTSNAEVKERVELYIRPPNTPSWGGAQLKHRDNFTLPGVKRPGSEADPSPSSAEVKE